METDSVRPAATRSARAVGERLAGWLPVPAYLVLVGVFWGRFVTERGLHAETVWIELSQARPGWGGFLYPYDPNRRFMSVPFHLAYVLSDGSYLPLHLLFGLFVFLTGLLTWLLVRRLVPAAPMLAFLAGAFALVHGADQSTNTTPMIVVRMAVAAILGALLLFRIGWETRRWWLLVPAAMLQALSLWTYEPGLAVLSLGPVLIWRHWSDLRPWLAWSAGWMLTPTLLVASLVDRYLIQGETSYQSARTASDVDLGAAIATLSRLSYHGLAFWNWPEHWRQGLMNGCSPEVMSHITPALTAGTLGFAACAILLQRRSVEDQVPYARVALVAFGFLLVSYLPFLALGEVGAWRTQFYSAPAAAVLLATGLVGVDRLTGRRGLAIAGSAAVVAAGLFVGLVSQLEMSYRWRIHLEIMNGIVAAAPRLRDDTFVALTNVPTTQPTTVCESAPPVDPFLDTMWFNSALQVLYPGTRLVGIYWRTDGISPGAIQFEFDETGASLVKTAITVEGDRFPYEQVVAFRYIPGAGTRLAERFPAEEIPGGEPSPRYSPRSRILPGMPPAETLNKLGL